MFSNLFLAGASEQLALGNMLFLLVSMIVLLLLLKKFAWGPVSKMMQDRADKIAHDLDSAEDARQKAQDLESKRQEQLQSARTDANAIIADAQTAAGLQRDQIVSDANDSAQAMKATATAQIEQERVEAMAGVKNDVAELSITIAQKIIQKELKLEDQKALIDAYVAGLGDK
ncbi:ATP synthase F0 subunit B [Weissella muntiaci]|jgi:F-type H+-transporting ATPase subunit b|uniref:ATP synthase subunit b n=1 Tax=Weissella muntiaci TaxID=2508881 RepID=A0A6C2C5W3_9LACO|nr:F0F1 ATP synthase subunit B [Weissella muntiaci]TYC48943.1 ATP synthase F0 subunit B [Weissella muntiaci]